MENDSSQQPVVNLQPADFIKPQPPVQLQPLVKHKNGMSRAQKIVFGILMPVLFVCGFGLGFLTHSLVSNTDTTEQNNGEKSESESNKNSSSNTEQTNSNATKPSQKLQRVDVNGMSVSDACATAREGGWRVEEVIHNDTYDSGSCASDGVIVDTYYFDYAESTYYGGIKLYYK